SSVSTWLYTIARNFCIKKRRRRAGAPETLSLDTGAAEAAQNVADAVRGPDALLQDKEIASALDGAISALEPVHREVLLLRDVEGLPASEVAEITGLSVPAVKSRLHRARARVRERLAPLFAPAAVAPPAPAPARPAAAPSAGCPDVVGLLSRRLEGEIGPDACAELERHVAGCPRCGTLCDSLRETLRLCGATALPVVPEALQESIREGIRGLLAHQG
ncbi:MAG TPA: sigma-70 family RNA polymerase sigma factor, partial [Vicinamibacteria bacterium]|nr:sigma-70 family RNA polymerase sigma factor [Vicinamibacteria bacterium]